MDLTREDRVAAEKHAAVADANLVRRMARQPRHLKRGRSHVVARPLLLLICYFFRINSPSRNSVC